MADSSRLSLTAVEPIHRCSRIASLDAWNIGFPNFLWQNPNPLKRRWLSATEQASTGNH
jgi:hypothetical protein